MALDPQGQALAATEMKTAGPPATVVLLPDRRELCPDPDDLCFITVQVRDADGVLQPLSNALIEFRIEGPVEIAAVGSGDPTSLEPFIASRRRAFHGQCLLIVRPIAGASGDARVSTISEGLAGDTVELRVEKR